MVAHREKNQDYTKVEIEIENLPFDITCNREGEIIESKTLNAYKFASLYHPIAWCEAFTILSHSARPLSSYSIVGWFIYVVQCISRLCPEYWPGSSLLGFGRVLPLVSLRYYNVNVEIYWLLVVQGYRISYVCTNSGKSTSKAQE